MGYKVKRNTITLKFEGDEFDGLEVVTNRLSVQEYLQLLGMDEIKEETPETVNSMLKFFADSLVSWNLEDEKGKTVPTTFKSLQSLDLEFVMTLIATWIQNIAGVSAPLGETSNSTKNSQVELTLPMEA